MESAAAAIIKFAFYMVAAIAILFETGAIAIGVTMISNGIIFGVVLVIIGLGTLIASMSTIIFTAKKMERS